MLRDLAQRTKETAIAVLICIAVLSCRREAPVEMGPGLSPAQAEAEKRKFLAREEASLQASLRTAQATMSSAKATVIYRVVSPWDERGNREARDKPKIAGYPIIDRRAISAVEARGLIQELTNRENYLPAGATWTCLFDPGFVVQFQTQDRPLNAVICLKCGEVVFQTTPESGRTHGLTPAGNRMVRRALERLYADRRR